VGHVVHVHVCEIRVGHAYLVAYWNSSCDYKMLEHQALMVHHTSPEFSRSGDRPTFGNNRSSDQP
jgi:hypothetical protein